MIYINLEASLDSDIYLHELSSSCAISIAVRNYASTPSAPLILSTSGRDMYFSHPRHDELCFVIPNLDG